MWKNVLITILLVSGLLIAGDAVTKPAFMAAVDNIGRVFDTKKRPLDAKVDIVQKERSAALKKNGDEAIAQLNSLLKRYATDEEATKLIRNEITRIEAEIPVKRPNIDVSALTLEFKGHHYLVVIAPEIQWTDARILCEKVGGHLAYIETKDEQMFLAKLTRVGWFWVGAYKPAQNTREWRWANNQIVDYTLGVEGISSFAYSFVCLSQKGLATAEDRFANAQGFICEWD